MIPNIRGSKVCHADIKAVKFIEKKYLNTAVLVIVKLESKLLNLTQLTSVIIAI